jgi:hypothetical protein
MSIISNFFKVDAALHNLLCQAQEEIEAGEVSEETTELLKQRAENKAEFVRSMGCWHIQQKARLDALEAEYKPVLNAIELNLKACKKSVEFAEKILVSVLPNKEEQVDDVIEVKWRKSEVVEVIDESKIPIEFVELISKPDKMKIKGELKAGIEIPGVQLGINYNIQIGAGGEAAIKRAARRNRA